MQEEQHNSREAKGTKTFIVFISFFINLCLSIPVYWAIMGIFDISTSGFLNFNGLFVAIGAWLIVALLGIISSVGLKKQLHPYQLTILRTQVVFFVFPFFLFFILGIILTYDK